MAAAQAAYSLLSDDSDSESGSDTPLSGSQSAVGVAEQQVMVDAGDAGDKSAPGKQKGKAGAEAGGAAAGGAATAATAAAGTGDGGGATAAKGADGRAAGVTPRQRPRMWSVKKAGATVAAVRRLLLYAGRRTTYGSDARHPLVGLHQTLRLLQLCSSVGEGNSSVIRSS